MKQIVAGVLRRGARILICQRARGSVQELRWEFPGGKLEPGEDEPTALRRELREELGVQIKLGPLLARIRHRYAETGELELAFYDVLGFDPDPRNLVFERIVWELPERFDTYDFLPADRPVLDLLRQAK